MIERLECRLARGRRHLTNQRLKLALFDAEGALEEDCECGQAWELKGLVHFDQAQFDAACDALERASLFVPIAFASSVCIAECYGFLGRSALAEDLLVTQSKRIASEDPEDGIRLAWAFYRLARVKLAADVCRLLIADTPDFATAYFDLAYFGGSLGMAPHAVEALIRHAIFLEPRSVKFRVGLCQVLALRGLFAEASHEICLLRNAELTSTEAIDELRNLRDKFMTKGCRCLANHVDGLLSLGRTDTSASIDGARG